MQKERLWTEEEMVQQEYELTYGEPPKETRYMGCFGITALYLMRSPITVAFATISYGKNIIVESGLHNTVLGSIKRHEKYFSIGEDKRYK